MTQNFVLHDSSQPVEKSEVNCNVFAREDLPPLAEGRVVLLRGVKVQTFPLCDCIHCAEMRMVCFLQSQTYNYRSQILGPTDEHEWAVFDPEQAQIHKRAQLSSSSSVTCLAHYDARYFQCPLSSWSPSRSNTCASSISGDNWRVRVCLGPFHPPNQSSLYAIADIRVALPRSRPIYQHWSRTLERHAPFHK
jgi:hypothetical protein